MKGKPKIKWEKQWERAHRRAFKVAKAWWQKQMPPQGWGVKS